MSYAKVKATGLWSGYGGKHEPVKDLELVSFRQSQEKIFFGVIEESPGPWGFHVLVDGKPSTLNPTSGTDATPQDVANTSEQAFWFYLPKDARRTTGKHIVAIRLGHFEKETFIETSIQTFTVRVNVPEEE